MLFRLPGAFAAKRARKKKLAFDKSGEPKWASAAA
jgi:hypothetical protein